MKIVAKIAIALSLIGLLYLGYKKFQDNSFNVDKQRRTIDSLNREILRVDSLHVKNDSVVTVYKDSIVYVDRVIDSQKTKYVQIKHKYDEIRNHVYRYTPTQLDSFFSNRYGHLETDTLSKGR
jgi:hypothetical protein